MTASPSSAPKPRPNLERVIATELARRGELQPLLEDLLRKGKAVYELLRPLAKHVADVPRDYPLRHQQVSGWGGDGPGGVADYLMIALGPDHDLVLYHNFDVDPHDRAYEWQLRRNFPISDTHYEQTTVKDNPYPAPPLRPTDTAHIEVSRYRYGVLNRNANHAHDGFLCSTFNGYAGAEGYIADFEQDLEEALRRFAPATS